MGPFLDARFGGIERIGWTLRIASKVAHRRQLAVVVGTIPIAGPLPYVAGDVIESVAVWWKLRNWRDPEECICAGVVIGKVTLMAIRHPPVAILERIAPGEHLAGQPAARRKFPLRFGRQPLAGPLRVGERVLKSHLHDRPLFFSLDGTRGTGRVPPARAANERPPK